jgi:hypothetical protein
LATDCFLPVLNLSYGDARTLPFDIAHRRHPITFSLQKNATKGQVQKEKKDLVKKLVEALEPYLTEATAQPSALAFPEAQPKMGKAFYFAEAEVLGRYSNTDFVMPFRTVIYMRIIPRARPDGHLDIHTLRSSVNRYGSFNHDPTGFVADNKYGVVVGTPAGNTMNLDAVLQYFRTGEVWGINADILRQGDRGTERWVLTKPIEDLFIATLQRTLRFHEQVSGIMPPFSLELGLVGASGRKLAHTGPTLIPSRLPVLVSDEIIERAVLNRTDEATQLRLLLSFFEKVNMDSGVPRPKGLYGR